MDKLGITPEFITEAIAFCEGVDGWVSNNAYAQDHYVNSGRFFMYARQTPLADKVSGISDIFLSFFDTDKIRVITDEQYPHAFSCVFENENTKNKGVFTHIDPEAKDGWHHLRINIMLQAAENGGEPVIARKMYPVKTGECWSLWAGKDLHSAFPVQGNKVRVLLSLGYHVNPEYKPAALEIIKKLVNYAT